MGKSKSCRSCGSKKKCSGAHVYAIELKPEVIADKQFRIKAGIDENFKGRCFYVGQTKQHSVECRYRQHRAKKRSRRDPEATFECLCKTGIAQDVKYSKYNKGNRFVRGYALARKAIAYDLFEHLNPLPKNVKPEDAERELALSLREKGYAVHFA